MRRFSHLASFALGLGLLAPATANANPPLSGDAVMTAEQQEAITPDAALQRLMDGNARFVAGTLSAQDIRAEVAATAGGQYPHAIVLSCLDSRIPVETVFDVGIGDIFVGRVAGNVVDDQMLGSLEFGAAAAGSKLIVVLGHTSCGAVKGACDDVDLGHITALVDEIRPSVDAVVPEGESCDSSNHEHVTGVATHNVGRTIERIRGESEILRGLEASGDLRIVGAMYDLETGVVTLVE